MRIQMTAITHRGLKRDHNEDALGWGGWAFNGDVTTPMSLEMDVVEPLVFVVCDGMGGHAGGDTASRLAASMLTQSATDSVPTEDSVRTLLQGTADAINDIAERNPHLRGMGSTVVGLVIYPDGNALVFNVGDSRCYRVEGRYLAQLSTDHRIPESSSLTQALGGRRMVLSPDFFSCPLPAEQGLILCTDGLDDYATFADIEARALNSGPLLVADLRDLALAGGGGDNVSVLQVARIEQEGHDG